MAAASPVGLTALASGQDGPASIPSARSTVPSAEFASENGTPTVPINTEPIDVGTVDPLSYRARAVRLPPGRQPRIDGRMVDDEWQLAPAFGNFVQVEPDVGRPATQPTEFRILYDDRAIYFGLWMWDREPENIRASELKRDALLRKGDQIKVAIDTFNDRRNVFYFSTNPLGAYKDGTGADNGRLANFEWNANWLTAATRDRGGWYAEIEVPLSQIRYRESAVETVWGVQVCRVIIRRNESSCWTPYPREFGAPGIFQPSLSGLLDDLTGLGSRRRLEATPYVTSTASRNYSAAAPTDLAADYGGDLRVGMTPTLTSDFTYRTDFGQVEADQEIVNLTRFSLFFPENRPFFTEAATIFDYGSGAGLIEGDGLLLPLYYSRRIGLDAEGREIPLWGGGRMTGRVGDVQIGVLSIQTQETRFALAGPGSGAVVPTANHSVARIKKSIFRQSSIGAIFTNREDGDGAGTYNRSAGLDLGLRFGTRMAAAVFAARTFSPTVAGNGTAAVVDVDYQTDRLYGNARYRDIGEGFNAEMGFITRTDVRNPRLLVGWTPWPGRYGIKKLDINAGVDYYENHRGLSESRADILGLTLTRNDNAALHVRASREFDRLTEPFHIGPLEVPIGGYTWNTQEMAYATDRSRRLYGEGAVTTGGYYSGDRTSLGGSVGLLPLETLLVEFDYRRNRITLPQEPTYTTNTVNARVSHSFTPDLFVKSFIQYNDARRLANLNFLIWYRYRMGSDLYLVYNEGWDTDRPGAGSAGVRDRSLQIKLTYWFAR